MSNGWVAPCPYFPLVFGDATREPIIDVFERIQSHPLVRLGGDYCPMRNEDYINAHGTGTPLNDKVETLSIKNAFGKRAYSIPISSIKSAVGHCLGAAGAIEAIASILSIIHQFIPPTLNHQEGDEDCDLDYVPRKAREIEVNVVLSNSFAFGGNNVCLNSIGLRLSQNTIAGNFIMNIFVKTSDCFCSTFRHPMMLILEIHETHL
jgi:hypothetical protein